MVVLGRKIRHKWTKALGLEPNPGQETHVRAVEFSVDWQGPVD